MTTDAAVELHMLPVETGDATLLVDRTTGTPRTVLIDAGLDPNTAVSYLQSLGVFHLDLIVLSHPDLDHLRGLIGVVRSDVMSVGRIWCFDLNFLRDFICTGALPAPKRGTDEFVYYCSVADTLVQMDEILKVSTKKQVRCFQVSEGHKLIVGNMLIEVLHPWSGFYDSLSTPQSLRRLLDRKWPVDWTEQDIEGGDEQRPKARGIERSEQDDLLRRRLRELDISERTEVGLAPLTGVENWPDFEGDEQSPADESQDTVPLRMIGRLYNNMSIVVKVSVLGGTSPATMLFPGDLTDWSYLISRQFPHLCADLLKYPHHGSKGVHADYHALECPSSCWECWCSPRFRYWPLYQRGGDPLDLVCLLADKPRHAPHWLKWIVNPSHTLVFPYHYGGTHLPTVDLGPLDPRVHANRGDQSLNKLANASNQPQARVLQIGPSRHDITVVQ